MTEPWAFVSGAKGNRVKIGVEFILVREAEVVRVIVRSWIYKNTY